MKPPVNIVTEEPASSFVVMTKDLVDRLLEINTRNRNMRPQVVEYYRQCIENGMWLPTNQGIGVSASGFLIDGQNRLEALKEAGYPHVRMLLVTGLSDQAMAAVDSGANRSARDYLHFLFDTKVSAQIAAILRTLLLEEHKGGTSTFAKFAPQQYAEKLQEVGDSINAILSVEGIGKTHAPVLAAIVLAHHNGYVDESIKFAELLATGEMLERDNPVLVLRNWLNTTKGGGGAPLVIERYQKTVRALQLFIDGKKINRLYSTRGRYKSVGKQANANS
jgi:hypothetical protein